MILLLYFIQLIAPIASNENDEATKYLEKFGYLASVNPLGKSADAVPDPKLNEVRFKRAISEFQLTNGLPVTGQLDDETKRLMTEPRCGNKDTELLGRDVLELKWSKQQLKWTLLQPRAAEIQAMNEAFAEWSKVADLDITYTPHLNEADITISFQRGIHGDGYDLDGPGGVLAHAFFPENGQVHFDLDERWISSRSEQGNWNELDLYTIAVHEFGHALGLFHSRNKQSVMFAYYKSDRDDNGRSVVRLAEDDVEKIRGMYGEWRTLAYYKSDRDDNGRSVVRLDEDDVEKIQGMYGEWRTLAYYKSDRDDNGRSVVRLADDDVEKIQGMYGVAMSDPDVPRSSTYGTDKPTPRPIPKSTAPPFIPPRDKRPNISPNKPSKAVRCADIDTVVEDAANNIHVFVRENLYSLQSGQLTYEGRVDEVFPKAPTVVDLAATTFQGRMLLVSKADDQVYAYEGSGTKFSLGSDFPKDLPLESSIHDIVSMMRVPDGHTTFLTKTKFHVYDENYNVDQFSGRRSDHVLGIEENVRATFWESDRLLYIADGSVYQYLDDEEKSRRVGSVAEFFGCT